MAFQLIYFILLGYATKVLVSEVTNSRYCVVIKGSKIDEEKPSRKKYTASIDECISACDFNCVAITFIDSNWNSENCYLYSTAIGWVSHFTATTVLCGEEIQRLKDGGCVTLENTQTKANTSRLESFPSDNIVECEYKCRQSKDCKYAVFKTFIGKECNLFGNQSSLVEFSYDFPLKTTNTILCNKDSLACTETQATACSQLSSDCVVLFPEVMQSNANDARKVFGTCKCKKGFRWNSTVVPEGYCKAELQETSSNIRTSNNNTKLIYVVVGVAVPLVVILVLLVICIFMYKRRQNSALKGERKKETVEARLETLSRLPADISKPLDKWEINPQNFDIVEEIGNGAFGTVYSAFIGRDSIIHSKYANKKTNGIKDNEKVKVAVKMVKEYAEQHEKSDFNEEIKLMKAIGNHKNIVSMIGCSTMIEPFCLVVEYMSGGDLLKFLRKQRRKLTDEAPTNRYEIELPHRREDYSISNEKARRISNVLTQEDLLSFAWQISSGMDYLASKNLIHRDLAARNILIGDENNIKISDFGLTRFMNDDFIYTGKTTRKLPLRWMSIEAICDYEFTTYSDIWAFGVVLFEIATIGGTPYPGISNKELLSFLKSGGRMTKPENCSQKLYKIMLSCWHKVPKLRPAFNTLHEMFEEMLTDNEPYISFVINEEERMYLTPSFNSEENKNDFDF